MIDKIPHIWIPRVGVIEGEFSSAPCKLSGEYTVKKYKADGRLVQEVGPFSNLITNAGLNRIGTGGCTRAFIGTGTNPASASDEKMGNYKNIVNIGSFNSRIIRGGAPDYWVIGSGTSRFPPGTATGNVTEVGIGWVTTGGNDAANHRVFSRALTVDENGSPISITVLSDEYLDVTYSIKYWPPLSDSIQEVLISGVSYIFATRALSVDSGTDIDPRYGMIWDASAPRGYTGTNIDTPPSLAPYTSTDLLSPGASDRMTLNQNEYVNGSLTLSSTITASLTQSNLDYGIRGLTTHIGNDYGSIRFLRQPFQTTITPAIPKTSNKILSFGMSLSWARR